jgi:hypothetical protein
MSIIIIGDALPCTFKAATFLLVSAFCTNDDVCATSLGARTACSSFGVSSKKTLISHALTRLLNPGGALADLGGFFYLASSIFFRSEVFCTGSWIQTGGSSQTLIFPNSLSLSFSLSLSRLEISEPLQTFCGLSYEERETATARGKIW